MSRNLLNSACCGNIGRLSDLRSKPIEFRRYGTEPVVIGTKWVCPSCKTTYFAWWCDAVWQGGFDVPTPKFAIDLSNYDTFNDEQVPEPINEPRHLCLDNAEDNQNTLDRPEHLTACCGHIIRLSDLRGKPIEFRRYGSEPVAIGTKWVCPSCKTTYFAWWHDAVWQGGYDEPTPQFHIDLSYNDTFKGDEHSSSPPTQKAIAGQLCLNNAKDNQDVLGRAKYLDVLLIKIVKFFRSKVKKYRLYLKALNSAPKRFTGWD